VPFGPVMHHVSFSTDQIWQGTQFFKNIENKEFSYTRTLAFNSVCVCMTQKLGSGRCARILLSSEYSSVRYLPLPVAEKQGNLTTVLHGRPVLNLTTVLHGRPVLSHVVYYESIKRELKTKPSLILM
jgi:hypothetical protein